MSSPAYELTDVTFGYKALPVISIGHMKIEAGEFVALEGPNGAGKTTLLSILGFLDRPWSGEIRFFGKDTRDRNPVELRREVGILLQNPYLFNATVLENVMWGLRIRGIRGRQGALRAEKALDSVGLSGFQRRKARLLSGGEAQRVAMARVLALDPDVILLDEPANNMDAESARRLEGLVSDLKGNKTLVLSTHNLSSWAVSPDRVIRLPEETNRSRALS